MQNNNSKCFLQINHMYFRNSGTKKYRLGKSTSIADHSRRTRVVVQSNSWRSCEPDQEYNKRECTAEQNDLLQRKVFLSQTGKASPNVMKNPISPFFPIGAVAKFYPITFPKIYLDLRITFRRLHQKFK